MPAEYDLIRMGNGGVALFESVLDGGLRYFEQTVLFHDVEEFAGLLVEGSTTDACFAVVDEVKGESVSGFA